MKTFNINNIEIVANSLEEAQATFNTIQEVRPSVDNIELHTLRSFLKTESLNTKDNFQFKHLDSPIQHLAVQAR
jgi:hypothetical protein